MIGRIDRWFMGVIDALLWRLRIGWRCVLVHRGESIDTEFWVRPATGERRYVDKPTGR
jgi:hypothetical protein